MTDTFTKARRIARTFTLTALAASALTLAAGLSDRGAAQASAPRACVEQVMHGGVNWGGGTDWRYENAAALCKGAVDYSARINCFQQRIYAGNHWEIAIRKCQPVGADHDPHDDTYTLNGGNVGMVEYSGGRFEMHSFGWVELDRHGRELDTYREIDRDAWTVYLWDQNRDVYVNIDMYNYEIVYEGYTRYRITGGDYATPKAPPREEVYTVNAGPIRNNHHAEKTCNAIARQYDAAWTGYWTTTVPGRMSVCEIRM